jgi:crossover junction endodeoxyribonuclease RuvC
LEKKDKIILGIDPGTVIMGYSLLSVKGNTMKMLEMDVVKLNGKKDMFERLGVINEVIQELIDKYNPTEMAIEAPFFGKNVQSMLKLGRAQGVAIAVAMMNKITVAEYAPKKIKQSVTGNGNAGKEQVMKMLQQILSFKEDPKYMDATDALAVAVCHHFQQGNITTASTKTKKSSGWSDFLSKNPERVKKV